MVISTEVEGSAVVARTFQTWVFEEPDMARDVIFAPTPLNTEKTIGRNR